MRLPAAHGANRLVRTHQPMTMLRAVEFDVKRRTRRDSYLRRSIGRGLKDKDGQDSRLARFFQ